MHEIYMSVHASCRLSFEYVAMVFAAAVIAAIGLIQDSSVTVVASMLLSPLMAPIICITFGLATSHSTLIKRGVRAEILGVLLAFGVGALSGIVLAHWYGPRNLVSRRLVWSQLGRAAWGGDADFSTLISPNVTWPFALSSKEITSRGSPGSLVGGALIAIPSAFGAVVAICGSGGNALVGVAIAAALLPPVVNAGLCMALAVRWQIQDPDADWGHDLLEMARPQIDLAQSQLATLASPNSEDIFPAAATLPSPLPSSLAVAEAKAAADEPKAALPLDVLLPNEHNNRTSLPSSSPPQNSSHADASALTSAQLAGVAAISAATAGEEVFFEGGVGGIGWRGSSRHEHPYIVVALHGLWSLLLFLLNFILIIVVGALTFHLKGVNRHANDCPHYFPPPEPCWGLGRKEGKASSSMFFVGPCACLRAIVAHALERGRAQGDAATDDAKRTLRVGPSSSEAADDDDAAGGAPSQQETEKAARKPMRAPRDVEAAAAVSPPLPNLKRASSAPTYGTPASRELTRDAEAVSTAVQRAEVKLVRGRSDTFAW